MSGALAVESDGNYLPVPLVGIDARAPLDFPVYLRTASAVWVLYLDQEATLGKEQVERLLSEGIVELHIRPQDRQAYLQRIERRLEHVLQDRSVSLELRADVLTGVAQAITDEVFSGGLDREGLERAQRMLVSAAGLVLRESQAFSVMRSMIGASSSLARHSVAVGFLAIGLARELLSREPQLLVMAGLAGLLHDVGRIGHEDTLHDPEHVARGVAALRRMQAPDEVVEAVAMHHERWDGSGYPDGKSHAEIGPLAQITAVADTFERAYSAQGPRATAFVAIQSIAESQRTAFNASTIRALIGMFRRS
jgi:putative nucleotidyltransferase with HDIG domain